MRETAQSQRHLTPDLDALEAIVTQYGGRASDQVELERVYLEGDPLLDMGAHLRGSRAVGPDEAPEFVLSHRSAEGATPHRAPVAVPYHQLGAAAERWFNVRGARPVFRVNYTLTRYAVEDTPLISALSGLHYTALIGDREIPMGREESVRLDVSPVSSRLKPSERALIDALEAIPKLPQNRIRLMGFSMLQKLLDVPMYSELMGFEYDLKFDASTPEVKLDALPLPLLDIRSSGSLRRYYKGFRAGLRDGTAILVRKGEMDEVRGVIKRTEVKERGVSAWDLDETSREMRRYKREIRIYNPESLRVYNVAVHQCVAGEGGDVEQMYQLELGYDGTLIEGTIEQMRAFWDTGEPEHLHALATLLEGAGRDVLAADIRARVAEITGADDPEVSRARLDRKSEEGAWSADAEREVIDDLLEIKRALSESHELSPSTLTKRKWLKRVLKRQSKQREKQ